jgi:hypothetical protein
VAQVRVTQKLNAGQVRTFLTESQGIRRGMLARGLAVQTAAKQRLNEPPRRIDTGRLRNSIQITERVERRVPVVRVGTDVFYSIFIHQGVRPHIIVPRNASVLAWRGPDGMVFATRVMHPGFDANPFLTDGLARGIARFSGA